MKIGIYFFKKEGTASLLVASTKKARFVRKYYKRGGYKECEVQRNKHGIPVAFGNVRMIRQDVPGS